MLPAPPMVAVPAELERIEVIPGEAWLNVPATLIPPEFVTPLCPVVRLLAASAKVPAVTVRSLSAVIPPPAS